MQYAANVKAGWLYQRQSILLLSTLTRNQHPLILQAISSHAQATLVRICVTISREARGGRLGQAGNRWHETSYDGVRNTGQTTAMFARFISPDREQVH